MPWTNNHLQWLEDTGERINTVCGKQVPVYLFSQDVIDVRSMSAWAKHFRNHYCLDEEIELIKPPGMSNTEYLITQKFPGHTAPGPSIRSGDFAEILVADYLQYLNNYYVPRTRYDRKTIGNESTKGSDVLAFKCHIDEPRASDELLIYEVKAKLAIGKPDNRLQIAIDDSKKDEFRIAESLNAAKQRLLDKRDLGGVNFISRFQLSVDKPYKTKYGAAAVVTSTNFCAATLAGASSIDHPFAADLELLVIHGENLMAVANALYKRAADEA